MQFGAHVSIAGGLDQAPQRAAEVGSEVYQIFSRSPRGGPFRADKKQIENFLKENQRLGFKNWYIHAPYYINLASSQNRIFYGSTSVLIDEIKVAEKIKARYVVTHLGSAKERGKSAGVSQVIKGLKKIGEKASLKKLLLEFSAGAGSIVGDNFGELAQILKAEPKTGGICLDTCHLFAAGYDLSSQTAIKKIFQELEKILGNDKVKYIHLNDSKFGLGEKKDRHEFLGQGKIGQAGLAAFINYPGFKNLDAVLEIPIAKFEDYISEIKKAQSWLK